MIYVYGIFPDYVTLEGLGTFVEIPYTHTLPAPSKDLTATVPSETDSPCPETHTPIKVFSKTLAHAPSEPLSTPTLPHVTRGPCNRSHHRRFARPLRYAGHATKVGVSKIKGPLTFRS